MPDITDPHDKFLKAMLSDITAAREFMAHFLPADIVEILDMTTLRPVKESFLTGNMKELFSDLIFECRVKTKYVWGCHSFYFHPHRTQKHTTKICEYSDGTIPV